MFSSQAEMSSTTALQQQAQQEAIRLQQEVCTNMNIVISLAHDSNIVCLCFIGLVGMWFVWSTDCQSVWGHFFY